MSALTVGGAFNLGDQSSLDLPIPATHQSPPRLRLSGGPIWVEAAGMNLDDFPCSLRSDEARQRRREMLAAPHMLALNEYVRKLRERPGVEVPDFDPMDGGVDARVLFLFEKPGRMTSDGAIGRRTGSGFISRNNDDPSAEATFKFMRQAGIPRRQTISWNVVPWWNDTRKITAVELRDGASSVRTLIGLLPRLRAVVFVGRKAARAQRHLADLNLQFFQSAHPSPIVRAAMPDRWRAIPQRWSEVRGLLDPVWMHRHDAKPIAAGWYPVLITWDLGDRLPDAQYWDGSWGHLWWAISHFIDRRFDADEDAKAYAVARAVDLR